MTDTTRTMRRRRRRTVDLGSDIASRPDSLTPPTAANIIPAAAGTDAPPTSTARIVRVEDLVLRHWRDFFCRFREDEHDQEQIEYRELAAPVQKRLDLLPFKQRPDHSLMIDMMELLLELERSRFLDLSKRIDDISLQCDQLKFHAHTATLVKTHQVDEIERCAKGLVRALKGARMPESSARQVQEILALLKKLVESTASHRKTPTSIANRRPTPTA